MVTLGGLGFFLSFFALAGLVDEESLSLFVSTLTAASGNPFSKSRSLLDDDGLRLPWPFSLFAAADLVPENPALALLRDSSVRCLLSTGEKVIFFGVSGVATALTALPTFRADRRMLSLNVHCRFFAMNQSTIKVTNDAKLC